MRREKPGKVIDWQLARQRLERAVAATSNAGELSPEAARDLLHARARALATSAVAPQAGRSLDVLSFRLGGEQYLIEAEHARSVERLAEFTPLPGVPSVVVGIANVRGELVCVVDLRELFGLPSSAPTDMARVITLGAEATELGLLADEVTEARTLLEQDIRPVPPSLAPLARGCVLGVTNSGGIVLDGADLLRDPRLYFDEA